MSSFSKKIRVLVAKPGLDGHDRGARVVARALRDAGFEVIYTGLHQTPEQIAETALQEDVDVVGLSILSGAHMTLAPRIKKMMQDNGMGDVLLVVGGIIPEDDAAELIAAGTVDQVFTPGEPLDSITAYLLEKLQS
ncbi:MAG: cobalamin B12-binding domain-containing protein [Dethiobacteria bacterium]|nr:cobalamin B12-binding domain-containing protein [Dethiobacteria bacterium]